MTLVQIVFYMMSAVAIGSGLMVVAAKNTVHSALCLVMAFIAMASVWITLQAEFLALILVLVYVGAVMTLFLFVVMMLNVERIGFREGFVRYLPIALVVIFAVVGVVVMAVAPSRFGLSVMPAPAAASIDYSNTADLGAVLYTQYALPFELAAVLLLIAIVAAIALTHSKRKAHKTQKVSEQIAVKAKDRIRLVDLRRSEG